MLNYKLFLLFQSCCLALFLFFTTPVWAQDISVHGFSSCGFPDTGQKICYGVSTGAVISPCPSPEDGFAQDGTYMSSATQPKYTVYNLVGISSVTVDNRTGLMWITNPDTDADMGGESYSWAGALAACEDLSYAGYSDWRLPNVRELVSIVNYQKYNPARDIDAFPTQIPGQIYGGYWRFYWTSTSLTSYCEGETCVYYDARVVDFSDGSVSSNGKTQPAAVRCVRGGP